jgi:hypothetical protein
MALKTRPPTGRVPWPLILIEGSEKAGKSWCAAELSASPKVGRTFWLDIGEGAADEYGAIPGARYEVIDHDGSWADILGQVAEVKALAEQTVKRGELPVVLVIDSMTAEWDVLKGIADSRARQRLAKRGKAVAPDAEPQISMDLWNDANSKHRRLMTMLMTFPGVAIVTARGKEVAALDSGGKPIEGRKEYKVEGHKSLAYDCSAWVRLSRDNPPIVVGARSVHSGVRPGVDRPVPAPSFTLEWLIFEVLKCDPSGAQVRQLAEGPGERTAQQIADEAMRDVTGTERLRELYREATALGVDQVIVQNGELTDEPLRLMIPRLGRDRALDEPAAEQVHKHMHVLWREAGLTDRDERLMFTAEILGRPVESSKELTGRDADRVIARLKTYIEQQAAPAPAENGAPA